VFILMTEVFMKKILILLPLLFLAACNPNKEASRSATRSNISGTIGGLGTVQCANGTSSAGSIYDSGSTSNSFEERVKALLSANVAATEVGQISSAPSDTTGVRFTGIIKLDSNGAVVQASSSLLIKVYDSYVLNGSGEAIPIEFSPAKNSQIQGQFNITTGVGSVKFSDSYGSITLNGTISAQTFSGVVQFQNSANVNGGTAASGTLGQFYVARCGIIQ
jgi:hypothetical protein